MPSGPSEIAAPPRRILVVDDSRDCATTLAALLRLVGHDVQTAYDGVEAVEKAEAFDPDAIFLDIGMPRLDGYAACRAIRKNHPQRKRVIVALTGWGQDQDRQKSQDAGFDSHLVKPPLFDNLIKLLDRLCATNDPPATATASR